MIPNPVQNEQAFNWWVHHVLKKRDMIISAVKRCSVQYLKRIHKFGIELPKMVDEAVDIDKKNGNTLWQDAIAKEMENVKIIFKSIPNCEMAPNGESLSIATLPLH